MAIGRRQFIQVTAVAAGCAGASAASAAEGEGNADTPGVLVDTTVCVGCRACEAACSETNALPAPAADDAVFNELRDTTQSRFTVVNRVTKDDGAVRFAKKQCMHCIAPGCASACPVTAMHKLPTGPVVYNPNKCMGCRYCMIACPFGIPKYEYDSWAPRVRKCTFCADRQAKGLKPACTEVCPSGALTFGKRSELLELAKTRIYTNPGKYSSHIYGETEAGGTSWLYISDVDLSKLGFRDDVPAKAIPELVQGALSAPPFVMTLWPPLLMGLFVFSKTRKENGHADDKKESHHG